MRIAQKEKPGFFGLFLQICKIYVVSHRVFVPLAVQSALYRRSFHLQGQVLISVPNRGHDKHSVSWFCEAVDGDS